MPRRSSKDHYFAVSAFRIVEQAIGEHMDGTPLEDPDAGKNKAAVALGNVAEVEPDSGSQGRLESPP